MTRLTVERPHGEVSQAAIALTGTRTVPMAAWPSCATLALALIWSIALVVAPVWAQSTDLAWEIISRSHLAHTQLKPGTSPLTVLGNAQDTYSQLRAALSQGVLTLKDVLAINGGMRAGGLEGGHVRDPGGGQLRTQNVAWYENGVPVHRFPAWQTVESRAQELDALLADVSSRQMSRGEAVQAAAKAHSLIAHEQLFSDGNHRTARAVADWVLMRQGLPPADYTAVSYQAYNGDVKASLAEYTREFEPVMDRAVSASEAHVAASAGPVAESVTRVTPDTASAAGARAADSTPVAPAARGLGSQVLGSAVHGLVFSAGMAGAGEVAREALQGERLDGAKILHATTNPATLAGGVGFAVGETLTRLAITAVSSAIPVAGVGSLLVKPLVTAALSGTVGAMSGSLAAHVVGGGPVDATDLIGSSVASGIGMAVGAMLLPGVGAIAGGIVGGLAWEIGRSLLAPRDTASMVSQTASSPSAPYIGTGPTVDDGGARSTDSGASSVSGVPPAAQGARPQSDSDEGLSYTGLERAAPAPAP